MDWLSWLSKTTLEPTLVYEYSLSFTQNELQEDDIPYFNHEILQSIGISIAKHRLEILKLARKENVRRKQNGLSRLVLAMNKTKKLFTRNIIGKWGLNKTSPRYPAYEVTPYRSYRSGAPRKINGAKEDHQDHNKVITTSKSMMWSGPIDGKVQEKLMITNRSHTLSGPLDGKMVQQERLTYPNRSPSPMVARPKDGTVNERMGFTCRSPSVYGAMNKLGLMSPKVKYYGNENVIGYDDDDDHGDQSLWSLMFQNMKPT